MNKESINPLIFKINRYSVNDGPGIRMTIFLKGCPLNCKWCHNPESQQAGKQKLYTKSRCIGCEECVKNCPEQACIMGKDGIFTDNSKCNICGICAEVCPSKATEISGSEYTINELLTLVEKDRHFFNISGGGITISGGEPMLHHAFVKIFLDECGKQKIHRTIDTSGYIKKEILLDIAERTDLFLYDLKIMDPGKHKKWTGVGNELILSNLRALSESGAEIEIRLPLIKGVNTDLKNLENTAELILSLKGKRKSINLLPYHRIGIKKFEMLGLNYEENGMTEISETDLKEIKDIFSSYGIETQTGG